MISWDLSIIICGTLYTRIILRNYNLQVLDREDDLLRVDDIGRSITESRRLEICASFKHHYLELAFDSYLGDIVAFKPSKFRDYRYLWGNLLFGYAC